MPTTHPTGPTDPADRPARSTRSRGAAAPSAAHASARSSSKLQAPRRADPAAADPPADPADAPADLAREAVIRLHAYALWERRGRSEGHAMEDWLQAEAELAHLAGRSAARLPGPDAEGAR